MERIPQEFSINLREISSDIQKIKSIEPAFQSTEKRDPNSNQQ